MRTNDLTYLLHKISKGVLDMKIGTPIVFFLIILIAFGFILSEYLQIREDYAQVVANLAEQSLQFDETSDDLANCEAKYYEAQQAVTELEATVTELNEKILDNESVITSQQVKITELENKIIEREDMNTFMQTTITELNYKTQEQQNVIASQEEAIELLKNQRNESDAQKVFAKNSTNSFQPGEAPFIVDSYTEIILVTIIIAQIIISAVLNSGIKIPLKKEQTQSSYVHLTPKERSLIINYRRSKRA